MNVIKYSFKLNLFFDMIYYVIESILAWNFTSKYIIIWHHKYAIVRF